MRGLPRLLSAFLNAEQLENYLRRRRAAKPARARRLSVAVVGSGIARAALFIFASASDVKSELNSYEVTYVSFVVKPVDEKPEVPLNTMFDLVSPYVVNVPSS